jgi:sodium/hydrogen antiporter
MGTRDRCRGMLAVAGVSRRLTDTSFTPAMAFVLIGVLVGPLVFDDVTVAPTGATVRTLAEATLAAVLFADASRIKLNLLRREYAVPPRLLAVGLSLTIAAGALLAAAIFTRLNAAEALVLAVVLAPTDAALGQAVVTEPRLPAFDRDSPAMGSVPAPHHRTRWRPGTGA